MKLNLDKNILSLKGEPLKDKLCNVFADMLAGSSIGKPAKMLGWAMKLVDAGEIELDKADAKFLIEFVENNTSYTNLVKAQLIDEIEKLKED